MPNHAMVPHYSGTTLEAQKICEWSKGLSYAVSRKPSSWTTIPYCR